MLRAVGKKTNEKAKGDFVIVASQYNARYVDAMVHAAQRELRGNAVKAIKVIRVPGAFEIPVVAARLARDGFPASIENRKWSAIICLGVILRGETVHAAYIGEAVTRALMQIQVETGVPVIHEVLLLENEEQARVRCLGKRHNRGAEAAQTAIAMARVMRAG